MLHITIKLPLQKSWVFKQVNLGTARLETSKLNLEFISAGRTMMILFLIIYNAFDAIRNCLAVILSLYIVFGTFVVTTQRLFFNSARSMCLRSTEALAHLQLPSAESALLQLFIATSEFKCYVHRTRLAVFDRSFLAFVKNRLLLHILIWCVFITSASARDVDLSLTLSTSTGFRILGAAGGDTSGYSVSAAGDVNGDGIGDIIVGAPNAIPPSRGVAGISYVIFGRDVAGGAAAISDIQLTAGGTALSPSIGFRILGAAANDNSGFSVSIAGDVNGDGIGDIILGTRLADPLSGADAGISYVIFGRNIPGGAAAFGDIQLTNGGTALSPTIGFRILGAAAGDQSGFSVSAAGDVNGDGIGDVIVGAPYVDAPSGNNAGMSYVIFGRNIAGGAAAFGDIQLTTGGTALSASVGFRILGAAADDNSANSVSDAGDVNGDGIGDVIVGTNLADPTTGLNAGISYVIFGRNIFGGAATFNDIQLTTGASSLSAGVGFRILGAEANGLSGSCVSAAGDVYYEANYIFVVNGDGIDDVIVGAIFADPLSKIDAGISYVIFGRNISVGSSAFGDIQLTTSELSASIGFRILGAAANDQSGVSVSAAGDVNGDGIDDVIVGARGADIPNRIEAGISYVIFGRNVAGSGGDIQLTTGSIALSPTVGFRIVGSAANDNSGYSVSAAGDVNGDGIDDFVVGAYGADPSSGVNAGITYVILGAYSEPTSQPSSQPSKQPTRQPSTQPSRQPSRQPSSQPTSQPTKPPTRQPTCRPTRQPSSQPSNQPTKQPVGHPSKQPFGQPTTKPSTQPSNQPTNQPTSQPTLQSTEHPSVQPSSQPSGQPSIPPTSQPSRQPTRLPSSQPIGCPSAQPSMQPSQQQSIAPTAQPLMQSTGLPSSQPVGRPSAQPSKQPSEQPSAEPSSQPSIQPTRRPSQQPFSLPSGQPTTLPSSQPNGLPSSQPSSTPSAQPSCSPSSQPTLQSSSRPTAQPTCKPSLQPSARPSQQPTAQPSTQPSVLPSTQPSSSPSTQPTLQPSVQPSSQPTFTPASSPSVQPSGQPTAQPSTLPSQQPVSVPSGLPTSQPSEPPTSQPSSLPTARDMGEWVSVMGEHSVVTHVAAVDDVVWACGTGRGEESFCISIDATLGTQNIYIPLLWSSVTTILQSNDLKEVILSGNTDLGVLVTAELAHCAVDLIGLTCKAKSIEDTRFVAGAIVPFVNKYVYAGATKSTYPTVATMDGVARTLRSYVYESSIMPIISLLHIQSPPNFIGGFIAGTCVNSASINYIFAGMVRTDSGTMTAMYLTPVRGSILNSAELVNAMALEPLGPDSFIAGGLQLSSDSSTHAYLVCVNSLYRRFIYGMRYVISNAVGGSHPGLLVDNLRDSVVKAVALAEKSLYLIINSKIFSSTDDRYSTFVLKTDMATGSIVQQVQIYSQNASIQCSDATFVGASLILACTVHCANNTNTTQSVVFSVNRELTFSKLPVGFMRLDENVFSAEPVLFKGTLLPMTLQIGEVRTTEYTFTTADGFPTFHPSVASTTQPSMLPSSVPSGQPSSSPTAAPSVSPQPTSQPSTSGPTNTYKPTIKPTQRPTAQPITNPTIKPSLQPSIGPTRLPSNMPTPTSSTRPSATPSSSTPSTTSSTMPTRNPSERMTRNPTTAPSATPTTGGTVKWERKKYRGRESTILGYAVAGLFSLWVLYQLCWWYLYKVGDVKKDKRRVEELIAQDLPGIPRYPIFSAIASLCFNMGNENAEDLVEEGESATVAVVLSANGAYSGNGAYMNGPSDFVDLEANTSPGNTADEENAPGAIVTHQVEAGSAIMPSVGPHGGETSDFSELSEVSSDTEESVDDSDSFSDDSDLDLALSEESEYSGDCSDGAEESDAEPSDDSSVIYSISSDNEVNRDDGEDEDASDGSVGNSVHNNSEMLDNEDASKDDT